MMFEKCAPGGFRRIDRIFVTIYDAGVDISRFTLGNRASGSPLDRQRILWMIESFVDETEETELDGLMDFFNQFHAGDDPAILTFRQLTPQEECHISSNLGLWVCTLRPRSANEIKRLRFSMVDGSVIRQLLEANWNEAKSHEENEDGSADPKSDPDYLKSKTLGMIRSARKSLIGQHYEEYSLSAGQVLLIFLIQEYPLSHQDL